MKTTLLWMSTGHLHIESETKWMPFRRWHFQVHFLENVWVPVKISLKFVPKGAINNIPALVQIMTWRRSGDKPLSEAMMGGFLMHICVTRPQWINILTAKEWYSLEICFKSVLKIYLMKSCICFISLCYLIYAYNLYLMQFWKYVKKNINLHLMKFQKFKNFKWTPKTSMTLWVSWIPMAIEAWNV